MASCVFFTPFPPASSCPGGANTLTGTVHAVQSVGSTDAWRLCSISDHWRIQGSPPARREGGGGSTTVGSTGSVGKAVRGPSSLEAKPPEAL